MLLEQYGTLLEQSLPRLALVDGAEVGEGVADERRHEGEVEQDVGDVHLPRPVPIKRLFCQFNWYFALKFLRHLPLQLEKDLEDGVDEEPLLAGDHEGVDDGQLRGEQVARPRREQERVEVDLSLDL